ncbi:MAG: anti-sigma factor domain-containing protein, partial [Thermaurantiacus sp.]
EDPVLPPEEPVLTPDEALAAEWALGILDGPARQAAEDRRRTDPPFAAMCAAWVEQLAPVSSEVAPVQPSPGHWARIEAALGKAEVAPSHPELAAARRAPSRWWDSLGLWRGATAAMAALALGLLVTRPPPIADAPVPPSAPELLLSATLADEGGAALVTAALDPGRGAVVLAPVGEEDLDGRVPQLWLIPADGTPRSLGLIDLGGTQRIAVPDTVLELVSEGAVLAVSLEPAGGSPTGLPTGPVVATGRLSRI